MQSTSTKTFLRLLLLASFFTIFIIPGTLAASDGNRCDHQELMNFLPPDVSALSIYVLCPRASEQMYEQQI